jgi:hypothetical protein
LPLRRLLGVGRGAMVFFHDDLFRVVGDGAPSSGEENGSEAREGHFDYSFHNRVFW